MNKEVWTVYAIRSLHRNYIYVGLTSNIGARLERHNRGYEKTTRPYAPFELIYSEEVATRPEARIREKYWKSGTGKRKLKSIGSL
ncbi:GIY-YIG nuclease family protein [Sanyastnella coralliicola]|uniref:GIY-YIG nuclease family protein n=1 Tax=Sanyastnella coralliicola TaxID=3069118 RepID=UPI0033130810